MRAGAGGAGGGQAGWWVGSLNPEDRLAFGRQGSDAGPWLRAPFHGPLLLFLPLGRRLHTLHMELSAPKNRDQMALYSPTRFIKDACWGGGCFVCLFYPEGSLHPGDVSVISMALLRAASLAWAALSVKENSAELLFFF